MSVFSIATMSILGKTYTMGTVTLNRYFCCCIIRKVLLENLFPNRPCQNIFLLSHIDCKLAKTAMDYFLCNDEEIINN